MNIEEQLEDGVMTLKVEGEIDGSNVAEFEEAAVAAADKGSKLIVDLGELEYVSSAGLRVFLMLRKNTAKAGKEMVMINVTDDVMEIFSVTGFVNLLPIE